MGENGTSEDPSDIIKKAKKELEKTLSSEWGQRKKKKRKDLTAGQIEIGSLWWTKRQKTGKGNTVLRRTVQMYLKSKRIKGARHPGTKTAERRKRKRRIGKNQLQEKPKTESVQLLKRKNDHLQRKRRNHLREYQGESPGLTLEFPLELLFLRSP